MPYLLQHRAGRLSVRRLREGWSVEFGGKRSSCHATAAEAITAAAGSRTGIAAWDKVSDAAQVSLQSAPWRWVVDSFEYPASPVEHLAR